MISLQHKQKHYRADYTIELVFTFHQNIFPKTWRFV